MSTVPSWRLKVNRAYKHFTDAVTAATEFIQGEPCQIIPDTESEPGKLRVWIKLSEELPDHIALAAGDAVHNMRSALDHIVYEISSRRESAPEWTAFPILSHKGNWEKRDKKGALQRTCGKYAVRLLPDAVQAFIESLQPYQEFSDADAFLPSRERLAQLHSMDIDDKHKNLNLAVIDLENLAVGHDGAAILPDWEYVHPGGPLKLNTPELLFQFGSRGQVDMKPIVTLGVAFSEGLAPNEPVPDCLREQLRCVEDVIREVAWRS